VFIKKNGGVFKPDKGIFLKEKCFFIFSHLCSNSVGLIDPKSIKGFG